MNSDLPPSPIPPGRNSQSRGVTQIDVDRVADDLLRQGIRPSTEKIRAVTGGSPNTIHPKLDAWWSRLAGRFEAGPAAFHRLPEGVTRLVESLWLSLVSEARLRAEQELGRDIHAHTKTQTRLESQEHAFSLRDAEREDHLRQTKEVMAVLRRQLVVANQQAELLRAEIEFLKKQKSNVSVKKSQKLPPPQKSMKVMPKKAARKAKSVNRSGSTTPQKKPTRRA